MPGCYNFHFLFWSGIIYRSGWAVALAKAQFPSIFTGKLLSLCVYTANWLVGFNCNSFYWHDDGWEAFIISVPCACLSSGLSSRFLSVSLLARSSNSTIEACPNWRGRWRLRRQRRTNQMQLVTLMKFNLTFSSSPSVLYGGILKRQFWLFAEAT